LATFSAREGIVSHRTELLSELGLSQATIIETEPSLAENVASFLTHPIVVPILLSLASLGLIVELYSPRSEERRVGKECVSTRSKRDWSSDVCSSDLTCYVFCKRGDRFASDGIAIRARFVSSDHY